MEGGKVTNSLFKITEICFGSTKMGIFYREKNILRREKKIRKNDFAPSENYACYAPGCDAVFDVNTPIIMIMRMVYFAVTSEPRVNSKTTRISKANGIKNNKYRCFVSNRDKHWVHFSLLWNQIF